MMRATGPPCITSLSLVLSGNAVSEADALASLPCSCLAFFLQARLLPASSGESSRLLSDKLQPPWPKERGIVGPMLSTLGCVPSSSSETSCTGGSGNNDRVNARPLVGLLQGHQKEGKEVQRPLDLARHQHVRHLGHHMGHKSKRALLPKSSVFFEVLGEPEGRGSCSKVSGQRRGGLQKMEARSRMAGPARIPHPV